MPTDKYQRLRYGRIPLVLALLICGALIGRIPLQDYVLASNEQAADPKQAVANNTTKPAATPKEADDVETVAKANPSESIAVAGENSSIAPESPVVDEHVPAVELPESLTGAWPNLGRLVAQAANNVKVASLPIPHGTPGDASVATPAEEPSVAVVPEETINDTSTEPEVDTTADHPSEVEPEPEIVEQQPTPPNQDKIAVEPPEVVLQNPADSGGEIHFVVDDVVYSLTPGEELRLVAAEELLLEFHRGGDLGNAEHRLSQAATFRFEPSDQGWFLTESPDSP